MREYYENKEDKTKDFIKGFLMNIGIGVLVFISYWIPVFLNVANTNFAKGIAVSIIIILLILVEYLLINKYLKERRYIAIGMISAIVAPLLVVGTCSPLFFSI